MVKKSKVMLVKRYAEYDVHLTCRDSLLLILFCSCLCGMFVIKFPDYAHQTCSMKNKWLKFLQRKQQIMRIFTRDFVLKTVVIKFFLASEESLEGTLVKKQI